jgi:hypothetical protein
MCYIFIVFNVLLHYLRDGSSVLTMFTRPINYDLQYRVSTKVSMYKCHFKTVL